MPQIRCPNCGFTVNLENRRKIDFELIERIVEKPRTFTELLRMTKLPRKTLALRLKALYSTGRVIKNKEGKYVLNKIASDRQPKRGFACILDNKKTKTLLILSVLLIGIASSGYVAATLLTSKHLQMPTKPQIIGNFKMILKVDNVTDLCAWQAAVIYNSNQLCVLKITPGDFLPVDFPYFVNSTDTLEDLILIGAFYGNTSGANESGVLAEIVFGYFTENFDEPKLVPNKGFFQTYLLDSKGNYIPIRDSGLSLVMAK